jgi:cytoplasmic iron level regulating protein YaaA (DUF328/UPF0246 family)
MKTRKLLARLADFLDADRAAQQAEIESIRKVLKKLKEKERNLRDKLDEETEPEERKAIAAKLDVVYAQRRKGLERVRAIRKGSEQNRDGD